MSGAIAIRRYHGQKAATQLGTFLPVYEEVYAEPPYCEGPREVGEFLDHFDRQARRPGFRLVIATSDDTVAGFSIGYLLQPDMQWWAGLRQPLTAGFTAETGHRTFAIDELAVRAPFRRCGIAKRLHTALLDGLTAERVTLHVRPEPEAAPAQLAYAKWGYRKLGQIQPWEGAPVYDAMVLAL